MVEEEKKTEEVAKKVVKKQDSIVKQLGYMKAQAFVCSNPEFAKENVKDVPFTTVANLVSALLTELSSNYVTGKNNNDKWMRKRIKKTIDIINSQHELASLIIKDNPFKQRPNYNQPDTVVEAVDESGSS